MNDTKQGSGKRNQLMCLSRNPGETRDIGKELGRLLKRGDLVALDGDLGAGKTTLIQGIVSGLKSKDHASSPSFSLIKEYSGEKPIYHFDLYRLIKEEEFEDLGYEEYFYGNGITLIEWAEKIKYFLPESMLLIQILIDDEHYLRRKIIFNPRGKRYKKIMEELKSNVHFGN